MGLNILCLHLIGEIALLNIHDYKKEVERGAWWHMSLILGPWEAEAEGFQI